MDKNNKKGFAQFIIILAGSLVILLSIVFFAFKNGQIKLNTIRNDQVTPPSDETASWKTITKNGLTTYVNGDYDFEISFPEEWFFDSPAYGEKSFDENSKEYYVLGISPQEFEGDWNILVSVIPSSFEKLMKDENYSWNKFDSIIKNEKVTISGRQAHAVTWSNNIKIYYFENVRQDKTISFSASPPNGDTEKQYIGIPGQILSTFQFVD